MSKKNENLKNEINLIKNILLKRDEMILEISRDNDMNNKLFLDNHNRLDKLEDCVKELQEIATEIKKQLEDPSVEDAEDSTSSFDPDVLKRSIPNSFQTGNIPLLEISYIS
jgi:hypothetical protein